jgi:hypothetical protein
MAAAGGIGAVVIDAMRAVNGLEGQRSMGFENVSPNQRIKSPQSNVTKQGVPVPVSALNSARKRALFTQET